MKKSHALLDQLMDEFILRNDAEVARFLSVPAPIVSKIRSGKLPVSGDRILQVYDKTGWPIEKIRSLLA